MPVLGVSIIYGHAESKRIEAVVDSGSDFCLFHASIGTALGMNLESGAARPLRGVVGGVEDKVYYHQVKIRVLGSIVSTVAGFSSRLAVAAILGRIGFFDNFKVTFNPEYEPPGME